MQFKKYNFLLSGFRPVMLALAVAGAGIANAAPGNNSQKFDIDAQPVGAALKSFAGQADVHIIFTEDDVATLSTSGVSGDYSQEEALAKLLEGTGLHFRRTPNNVIVIHFKKDETDSSDSSDKEAEPEAAEEVDEEIVVTGSRIARTPSQMAANVVVLNGDELRASGESTLEGALRLLPQNMFGASPVGATVTGSPSINGAINITGASTINLRGLGSESTLILVDGRRIGKTGVFGGVSDITGIPFSAIERVEILLDGASSIYGSDAVGGVVNVITKKDYQGLEVAHEYGTPNGGGFEEHVFSVNGGFSWDGGRLYAVYEHFQSSNLDGEERPESVAWSEYHRPAFVNGIPGLALLTYEGDRYFPLELNSLLGLPVDAPWYAAFSQPGVSFEFVSTFLPDNQSGADLSYDDFIFISRNSEEYNALKINSDASEGVSVIPAQQRDSLNLNFDQMLNLWGKEVTLSGAIYHSERQTYAANGGFTFLAQLPATNSSNIFGQPANLFWYIPDLAAKHYETNQQVSRWNLALEGTVGKDWSWAVSAGQSRDKADSDYFNEQVGPTAYLPLIDEGLNLYASDIMAANTPEILAQLIQPESHVSFVNEENTLDIGVDGTLLSLPGGRVHFALGADWRQEILETESSRGIGQAQPLHLSDNAVGSVTNISLPSRDFSAVQSKTQRSAYAEVILPVVGVDNTLTGVKQFNLTGSARYDSYHEQGSDSTWSLGLNWRPIDQARVYVNKSTSFVVPSFRDQLAPLIVANLPNGRLISVFDEDGQRIGFDSIGSIIQGGNPDLEPETGSALVAGLEFTPDFLPGLSIKATWHQTEYNNRIGPPQTQFIGDYVALYPNISRDEQGLLIFDRRAVNIGSLETAGIDYLLHYTRDTDFGQFSISMNVGYTTEYNRVQAPGSEPLNQVSNIAITSNTVIPATRYLTRFGWNHRGLSINLTANTSSKTVSTGFDERELSDVRRSAKPALNANLNLIYDFEQGDLFAVPAWLQSTAIELTVLNVLDDYAETNIINLNTGEPSVYSEFNANVQDPRGHMFKLGVTKRF